MRWIATLLIAASAVLGPAGVALAQSAGSDPATEEVSVEIKGTGKGGSGSGSAGSTGTGQAGTPAGTSAGASGGKAGLQKNVGSLPFTGIDLLIVSGVALVMLGTGFGLHRLSAPRI